MAQIIHDSINLLIDFICLNMVAKRILPGNVCVPFVAQEDITVFNVFEINRFM